MRCTAINISLSSTPKCITRHHHGPAIDSDGATLVICRAAPLLKIHFVFHHSNLRVSMRWRPTIDELNFDLLATTVADFASSSHRRSYYINFYNDQFTRRLISCFPFIFSSSPVVREPERTMRFVSLLFTILFVSIFLFSACRVFLSITVRFIWVPLIASAWIDLTTFNGGGNGGGGGVGDGFLCFLPLSRSFIASIFRCTYSLRDGSNQQQQRGFEVIEHREQHTHASSSMLLWFIYFVARIIPTGGGRMDRCFVFFLSFRFIQTKRWYVIRLTLTAHTHGRLLSHNFTIIILWRCGRASVA